MVELIAGVERGHECAGMAVTMTILAASIMPEPA
jgi:hypothetical protein